MTGINDAIKNSSDKSVEISARCRKFCPTKFCTIRYHISKNTIDVFIITDVATTIADSVDFLLSRCEKVFEWFIWVEIYSKTILFFSLSVNCSKYLFAYAIRARQQSYVFVNVRCIVRFHFIRCPYCPVPFYPMSICPLHMLATFYQLFSTGPHAIFLSTGISCFRVIFTISTCIHVIVTNHTCSHNV